MQILKSKNVGFVFASVKSATQNSPQNNILTVLQSSRTFESCYTVTSSFKRKGELWRLNFGALSLAAATFRHNSAFLAAAPACRWNDHNKLEKHQNFLVDFFTNFSEPFLFIQGFRILLFIKCDKTASDLTEAVSIWPQETCLSNASQAQKVRHRNLIPVILKRFVLLNRSGVFI